ncbi:MAG TPA: diguanylate cyclase [Terracidiphilus sp.]|nr:diguanylate cyclase [Terracidiphilus sp.]
MDWSKLPDVGAVALLTCAFASVARRGQSTVSGLWLIGWLTIVLHFTAYMFLPAGGNLGNFADFLGTSALAWAGILFMWAAVSYRDKSSSRLIVGSLLGATTLYIGLLTYLPAPNASLIPAAILFGAAPLAIALATMRRFRHPMRWAVAALFCALSIFLLAVQFQPKNGATLALNGLLFTVYFGCCIHFWYAYRRGTTGAFITIAGFLAWASVFVVGPLIQLLMPALHLEDEVWNLPKYVVAVGMILLLLEEQIEHNKYLALHDELTGLPNRRLFQDRLANAIERARRTGTHTALLLVDLNYFKRVNDTLGHHTGDLLLQRVSSILSGRVRRSDTVARTGGDEFSVILEDPTTREDAAGVCQSLMELLREPMQLGEHTVTISASAGIAIFPEDAPNLEALCIVADLHMYAEKYGGREAEQTSRMPVAGRRAAVQSPSSLIATD